MPKTAAEPKPRTRGKSPSAPAPTVGDAPLKPSRTDAPLTPDLSVEHPRHGTAARVYIGDTRELLPRIAEVRRGTLDLVFADPPFNWNRAYDKWRDNMPRQDYIQFTHEWISLCAGGLRPGGSLWINIPDDTAAEIVVFVKNNLKFEMQNWCIWHYRFGQNTKHRFINSKVHALWFTKPGGKVDPRTGVDYTWNFEEILEPSDRAAIYEDPRTMSKRDGVPAGMRVPMDVWYGKYWGRVQGNSKERRHYHDNQLPEAYLERVVRACSNPGDTVLDPFLGSGTTGVVAHALGRHFIGTEFSPENARFAFERIQAGPVRLGEAIGQSTAIFPHRRKTGKPAPASRR